MSMHIPVAEAHKLAEHDAQLYGQGFYRKRGNGLAEHIPACVVTVVSAPTQAAQQQAEPVGDERAAEQIYAAWMAAGQPHSIVAFQKGYQAAQSGQRAGVADGHTNTVYEAAQKLRSLAADLPDAWLRDEFVGIAEQIANLCQIPDIPSPHSIKGLAGLALVPIDPTEEMLRAADEGDREYSMRNFGDGVVVRQGPYDHWVAMIAAAPTQQQERSE